MSSLAPYTYLTLSMEPGTAPRLNVSFHTADLHIRAGMLDNPRPYLEIASREANVSISTTGAGPVTDDDLSIAREIFNAAARYLADCERLHTNRPATGKAATDTAA
ncbi:hypothetical protein GCM10022224_077520 [Nonomuraea antimicrobica]|uniref:Uncharacterized protein n=1 Tax=Nonomuraea antimicrobica TaxID=561173 RepID=A0ABP7D2R2_9ACTN